MPDIVVAKKLGTFSPGGDPESSLDIQYIASVGKGNTNWFITEADWLYTFAMQVLPVTRLLPSVLLSTCVCVCGQFANLTEHPSVISMSYGWYEGDQCEIDTNPKTCKTSYDYVARVNTEFQKIGIRGISVSVPVPSLV